MDRKDKGKTGPNKLLWIQMTPDDHLDRESYRWIPWDSLHWQVSNGIPASTREAYEIR